MVHIYNPSYVGGVNRRIVIKINLGKIHKTYLKNN
jgi:hypothetical protein